MRYLLIVSLFLVYGCGEQSKQQVDVNFSETVVDLKDSSIHFDNSILNVAVSAITSPKETFNQYEKLIYYIGAKSNTKIAFKQRKTYQEVNDLLANDELQLAFICSGAYWEAKDKIPLDILAVPVINGEVMYYSYIIVNAKNDFRSFNDLRSRNFAFTDPLSNSGYFYILDLLDSLDTTVETYFTSTMYTYGHDISIRAVALNLVDGAAIDGLIFEYLKKNNPREVKDIRIIKRSPPYGIPPIVVPANLSDSLKHSLQQLFLSMHEDSVGAEILKSLMIEKYVKGNPEDYSSIRKLK
jgi:phosphate/phosphite/phosphonate ABC transporter binding protein